MVRWPPGSVYAARRGQSATPATPGFWRSGRIVRVGTPDAPGSFRVIARFWRQRGRVRSGTILPERHFSPRRRVPQGMNQTQLRRMGRVGRSELERDRTGVRQRPTQTSDRGRRSDLAPAATQRSTRPDEPDDRGRPAPQGLGKVGSLGWAGDQVYGSSGASGHGSGGGGDGGRGAVEESDEADGEVAQGGRDQRVRWRCAAGGGPRP